MDEISHYYPQFPERTLYPLPASLSAAGYVATEDRSYRWEGVNRGPERRAIWQYTVSGEGALRIGGNLLPVPPGHAMLLTIPEDHCYYLPEQPGRWEFCYLLMEGDACLRIVEHLREKYGSVIPLSSGGAAVKTAETILEQCRNRLFRTPYQMAEQVSAFLFRITGELEETRTEDREKPPFLRRIFSALQRNPEMTADEMAAVSGYSRLYLDRIFKHHTGKTPVEFLLERRMQKATGLLLHTPMRIKEVAAECGFYDPADFCRMFRKKFGRTPTRYRKSPGQEFPSASGEDSGRSIADFLSQSDPPTPSRLPKTHAPSDSARKVPSSRFSAN